MMGIPSSSNKYYKVLRTILTSFKSKTMRLFIQALKLLEFWKTMRYLRPYKRSFKKSYKTRGLKRNKYKALLPTKSSKMQWTMTLILATKKSFHLTEKKAFDLRIFRPKYQIKESTCKNTSNKTESVSLQKKSNMKSWSILDLNSQSSNLTRSFLVFLITFHHDLCKTFIESVILPSNRTNNS